MVLFQLHNASKLSDWCMKFLCNHFLVIRQKYLKQFHKLSPDNIKFIDRNRWPPEWFALNYCANLIKITQNYNEMLCTCICKIFYKFTVFNITVFHAAVT